MYPSGVRRSNEGDRAGRGGDDRADGEDREGDGLGETRGGDADEPGSSADEFDPMSAEPVVVPIEPTLDLHSFQPSEVEALVENYLIEARRAGFTEVRIIHGRGIGVQREIVRAVLARTSFVVSFGDAPPPLGGWGATIATLLTDPRDPR